MGFHISDSKTALVYEYMEEGSLYSYLHDVMAAELFDACLTMNGVGSKYEIALLIQLIIPLYNYYVVMCGTIIMG